MKIAVTGGCGYIGSHTLVDLIENGFEVISIDNNSRSTEQILTGVEQITGIKVRNYAVDMCNLDALRAVFEKNPDVAGVIHFAAYKWVGESVEEPLLYYRNNLDSLLNLLSCINDYGIRYHVFSSSCSVYGNPIELPVTENTPLAVAESPYAMTIQVGERIIADFAKSGTHQHILLRYFNPVGAHPSGRIGEIQPIPQNLVPYITQTAAGILQKLTVFGGDYDTRDGSCIRDYIHVSDIADAHVKALNYLIENKQKAPTTIYNLGTGNGVSVLEAIKSFEKVSEQKLNYEVGPRRAGDVVKIYANNVLVKKELNWIPKYDLDAMMLSAWKWQLNLGKEN